MAEQRKAVIKNADMSEAMQQDAVDVASVALSKYNIEKVRECETITQYCYQLEYSWSHLVVWFFFVERMLRRISRKNSTKSTIQPGESGYFELEIAREHYANMLL